MSERSNHQGKRPRKLDITPASPERIEELLAQDRAKREKPGNLEKLAEQTSADIDANVADFKNIPEGVEQAADDKERKTITKLNDQADSLGQEAKTNVQRAIEVWEAIDSGKTLNSPEQQWGRSPKKTKGFKNSTQHYEPDTTHHFQPEDPTIIDMERKKPENITPNPWDDKEVLEDSSNQKKDTSSEIIEKVEVGDTPEIPKNQTTELLDIMNELQFGVLIEHASSLEELKTIISEKNISLRGSRDQIYDSQDIIDMIDNFDQGSIPTRAGGLRQKVCEIVLSKNPNHEHALALLDNLNKSMEKPTEEMPIDTPNTAEKIEAGDISETSQAEDVEQNYKGSWENSIVNFNRLVAKSDYEGEPAFAIGNYVKTTGPNGQEVTARIVYAKKDIYLAELMNPDDSRTAVKGVLTQNEIMGIDNDFIENPETKAPFDEWLKTIETEEGKINLDKFIENHGTELPSPLKKENKNIPEIAETNQPENVESAPETSETTEAENVEPQEAKEGFEQFFANLKLEDFEDIESLRERFEEMMDNNPELLNNLGADRQRHLIYVKDKYFESFISQAEAVLKEQIYIAKSQKEGTKTKTLKEEGKKFVKSVTAGGTYAAARTGLFAALKIGAEAAMPIKVIGGGVVGAGMSAFNYLLGKGYNKLNAKSLQKLAKQAAKMEKDGLDQTAIFGQLQGDMNALAQFDVQQQEDLKQQKSAAYEINNADLEEYFSGEDTNTKKAKLEDLQKLVRITQWANKSDGLYQEEIIQKRQELIKSLIDNGALEDFTTYQITKVIEQLSAGQELDEETKNSIALEAQLEVDRRMNVLLGDVVAQEKIAELDKVDKKGFKASYVAKLFGNTPPESLLQAATKGFVSGSVAGAVYTSAIAGAIYAAQQRLRGSIRAEVLKQSASEMKTTHDLAKGFDNFELTADNLEEAENMILDARARIKLPDIKEVERAKLELKINALQNRIIRTVQLEKIQKDNEEDISNLAKKIVSQRSKSIEKAIDVAKKEKKRKSMSGLWKTFRGLSRQEKLKILAKAGFEGAKGGVYGAIGAELANAGSAAMTGEDYDLGQSLDNIKDRATLGVGGAIESVKEIWSGDDNSQETVVDTSSVESEQRPDTLNTTTNVDGAQIPQPDSGFTEAVDVDSTDTEATIPKVETPQPILDDEEDLDIEEQADSTAAQIPPKVEIPKPILDDDFDIEDMAVSDEDLADQEDTVSAETSADTTAELPVNIFEGGVSIEDLEKVVCELDNDPSSPEAGYAKEALDQLFADKSLDMDKYSQEVAKHIGQELHLGNQQIVENVIANSGLNIASVIETIDRVNLEKEFGLNTYQESVSEEQLAKLAQELRGEKSAEASALLEYLEKDHLISYEQKFAIEHPSAEHAGLKAEETQVENQATHKLSLELGKDGAPKHLEQVFYRLGIDGMEFGEEITNVEAAQILNVGANLRVLSEGHDIAGINAEDFQKYVSIEEGKVTITNYEGFQTNIINPLIEHSREIITADNVADSGAVAYIDNIKDSTWGDMLSPEQITEEQINLDQKQIDAAEQRLFQATLSSTELGELVTNIESSSENSGTFVLDNEKIEVENNEVTKIGDTPLEEPINLNDKEAGDKLIDKTSELKQERFLSFVEENKQQMMDRLNEQLANGQLFKQEIILPVLETPHLEYDVTTQLNLTLDKLGFGDSHGQKDWIELKDKSVNDLLKGEVREHEARFTSRFMQRHHEAHMREFIQQAINDGKIEPPSSGGPATIEEAMKELMIQQTRESLQHDIARAEQKVIAAEKMEEQTASGAETLGDQIRESIDKASQTTYKEETVQSGDTKIHSTSDTETIPKEQYVEPESVAEDQRINEISGFDGQATIKFSYTPEGKVFAVDSRMIMSGATQVLNPELMQTVLNHAPAEQINDIVSHIEADAKSIDVGRVALGLLEKNGQLNSPEAEFIKDGIKHTVERYESRYGDVYNDNVLKPLYSTNVEGSDIDKTTIETESNIEDVSISLADLYKSALGKELHMDTLNQMSPQELETLKQEMEALNSGLQKEMPDDPLITKEDVDKAIKDTTEAIKKIDQQLAQK